MSQQINKRFALEGTAPPKPRGFAAMSADMRSAIAQKGGRAAHVKGTAHQFDVDEARRAGRKGGESVSRNREHMAAIGRKGGAARGRKHRGHGGGNVVTGHE